MQDLIILGAGGYAKQVCWIAESLGSFNVLGFYEDYSEKLQERYLRSKLITSDIEKLIPRNSRPKIVCAVGSIELRKEWVTKFQNRYRFASIIDSSTKISPDAIIGENVVILGNTICSVECVISDHVNVNWQCLVSHDVRIGKYTNISSGVKLAGGVQVGEYCEIGTNATVIPNISIGNDVIVGASAMVNRNLANNVTAVGVPVRTL